MALSISVGVLCVDLTSSIRPMTGYTANSVTDPRLNCKARIPDIQMINRYYGLVPKKFLINRRSEIKNIRSQVDYSIKTNSEQRNNKGKFVRSASLETTNNMNTGKDLNLASGQKAFTSRPATTHGRRESSGLNNSNGESHTRGHHELVARKMTVSKSQHQNSSQKWRFKESRTRSFCENFYDLDHPLDCGVCSSYGLGYGESCQESENSSPEPDVQRVIKINLQSMKWEESFDDGQKESLNSDCKSQQGGLSKSMLRRQLRKSASVEENFGTAKEPSATTGKGESVKSFAEPWPSGVTKFVKSRAKSAKPQESSAVERRKRFGALKTFSLTQAKQDGVVNGESSSEEEDPFPRSILSRHAMLRHGNCPISEGSKNGLHVQPPAEVTTMISSFGAVVEDVEAVKQEQGERKSEQVFTNIIKMTNGIQLSEGDGSKEEVQVAGEEKSVKVDKVSMVEEKECKLALSEPSASVLKSTGIEGETYERQECHYPRHNVPPLRKAASISCEQEITQSEPGSHDSLLDGSERNVGTDGNGSKPRCKTAKVRGSVSFARIRSTVPMVPPPSISSLKKQGKQDPVINCSSSISALSTPSFVGPSSLPKTVVHHHHGSRPTSSASSSSSTPSKASKNRRLLLKKALAELNQASASLNKKLRSQPHQVQRPKTAPSTCQPEAVRGTKNEKTGKRGNSHEKSNIEQGQVEDVNKAQVPKRRPISRQQSITFMENLFGSTSSLNGIAEDRNLIRQTKSMDDDRNGNDDRENDNNNNNNGIKGEKATILSCAKREECLRIYEKMKKTGCVVSLETIFRGMMTPSEYRVFVESLEEDPKEE